MSPNQISRLESAVADLYERVGAEAVPFHGWAHVQFVREKAIEFARANGGDLNLVSVCALVHDINYIVSQNSEPVDGKPMRRNLLTESSFNEFDCDRIESIIESVHTAHRESAVSLEAAALSDADTLFKALPITPVVLSDLYRSETGLTLEMMAKKIVREQRPLMAKGIYFYDSDAERLYGPWARTNLALWTQILECLRDPSVGKLLYRLGIQ